jgi:TatD DNase family protein
LKTGCKSNVKRVSRRVADDLQACNNKPEEVEEIPGLAARVLNFPSPGDYIDIHVHGGAPSKGVFMVESLMAHEKRDPSKREGVAYTAGIHPWYLDKRSFKQHMARVDRMAAHENVIAIGETGFDRLRGAPPGYQAMAFEEHVKISEQTGKPVIIHCVRAWDELLMMREITKPSLPWLIHGFRGRPQLAARLVEKGMYISFWFDFIIRPESTPLVRSLPPEKIFLETDGAPVDIRDIYKKVSVDIDMTVDELKSLLISNFTTFFAPGHSTREN